MGDDGSGKVEASNALIADLGEGRRVKHIDRDRVEPRKIRRSSSGRIISAVLIKLAARPLDKDGAIFTDLQGVGARCSQNGRS